MASPMGSVNTNTTSTRCTADAYFTVNNDTDAHYLEDETCCTGRKTMRRSSEDLHDGQSSPTDAQDHDSVVSNLTTRLQALKLGSGLLTSSISHWPQHIPFSTYPIASYAPDIGPVGTWINEPLLPPRVDVPQPFAYSLQLYETFERPDPPLQDTMPTPESISESTSNPSSSRTDACTLSIITGAPSAPFKACSSASLPSSSTQAHPSQQKRYALYLHYTKKAAGANPKLKVKETTELAPKGSTWEFAYDMFKKFFRKKTGLSWEDASCGLNGGDHCVETDARRDSGVGLSLEDVDTVAIFSKPFAYVPTSTQDLADVEKKYTNRYGEGWLPQPQAIMASSQDGKIESEEGLMSGGLADEQDESGVAEMMDGVEDERARGDEEME